MKSTSLFFLISLLSACSSLPPITEPQAKEDAQQFETELQARAAYYKLKRVSNAAPARMVSANELRIDLMKRLAQFPDSHAEVSGWEDALPKGYLPFLIERAEGKYIAFTEDRKSFLKDGHPYITEIDGKSMDVWLKHAQRLVPNGSTPLKINRGVRNLRYWNFIRSEAGLPAAQKIEVKVKNNKMQTAKLSFDLRLEDRPMYGTWPISDSKLLEKGIGYLRIAEMDDAGNFANELKTRMEEFQSTKGLILDLRGNSGGSRDAIQVMLPYFMSPKEEFAIVSVAAYRLHERHDSQMMVSRSLYPLESAAWTEAQKKEVANFAKTFRPEWNLPRTDFSDWHFYGVAKADNVKAYYYDKPVVVLMDANCFSATDIFLSALKGRKGIVLMGTASSGGSGLAKSFSLKHSDVRVAVSSMASFDKRGRLYDTQGVVPDVVVNPSPGYFLGKEDPVLAAAVKRLAR